MVDWSSIILVGSLALAFVAGRTGLLKMGSAKGKSTALWSLGVAGLVALMIFGVLPNWIDDNIKPLSIGTGSGNNVVAQSTVNPIGAGTGNCPDSRATTLRFRLRDEQASTLTYVASSNFYFLDGNNEVSNATSVNTGYSTGASLTCGRKYDVVAITQRGVAGSIAVKKELTGATDFLDSSSVQLSPLRIRLKDVQLDTYQTLFGNGNSAVDANNATTFTTLNTTYIYVDATGAANNITVGTDGYIDLIIPVKTVTARESFGDKGLPVFLCADLNYNSATATNWDEPVVDFQGVRLQEAKNQIDADSLSGSLVANSEKCYKLTDDGSTIGDTEKIVHFYAKAKGGQNPAGSDTLGLNLLPVGRYYSNKVPNTIKQGIYDDQSTQVLVVTASDATPTLVIPID